MDTPTINQPQGSNNRTPLVLVIGGASGFGAAIVKQMRRDNYGVIGTSRHAEPNTPIDPYNGALQQLDIRHDASVLALKQHLLQYNFNPDVIVLNAGYGISGPVEQTPTALAQEQFATNFFGLLAPI